jgi:hypothetical protein
MGNFVFVWDGFGAGLAYPKGLIELSVGDFDGSSPQLRCAGSAAFQRKAGLDATKRPVIIDKRFCARMGTKSASQTLNYTNCMRPSVF